MKKRMATISVKVPEDVWDGMKKFDINWSNVANSAFQKKLDLLVRFEKLTEKSTLTEADAVRIGRKLKKGIAGRHGL